MMYKAIESVFLAAGNVTAVRSGYERLGLRMSPIKDGRRTLTVGAASNLFSFRFLTGANLDDCLREPFLEALADTRPLFAVAIDVDNMDAALETLKARGIDGVRLRDTSASAAWLPVRERAGTDLVLISHSRSMQERHADALASGSLRHSLPLQRLDHLAVVAHDLEEKTRYWTDVLGVPLFGKVVTPTTIVRQLKIGDAILELLGPTSAESPIAKRPPGPVSMASWQVENLETAVNLVRDAGLPVTDPSIGVLPGTRIATIQGSELAGVNMQLLEYVRR